MKIVLRSKAAPVQRRILRWIAAGCLGLTGLRAMAANVVSSPDGNVVVSVSLAAGNLVYSVAYRGATVIETSPLGLTVNTTNIGAGVIMGGFSAYGTNETFVSRSGIHATATNWYQGQLIAMTHPASGISFNLDFRAYNNGVAFRYEFTDAATKSITAEASGFVIPANSIVWFQPANSTYEAYYRGTNISSLPVNSVMGPPATIQLAGTNGYLALTESTLGLFGNPYLTKISDATGRQLQVTYPPNQDSTTGAVAGGTINTPWNVIMLAADLNMIINNDMVESLAPPPDPNLFPQGIPAWVTTGRSVWDWLQPQPGGITCTNAMTNSLWASRLGFEYNTIDSGWSSWNGGNPWPQVQQVVAFSHALGVKVLLWKTSSELATYAQRSAFFQQLQTGGADGFKADFFDFNSASAAARERVQLRQAILQDAAAYHLVASFHGTPKPTGEFRTYPNLIETEGIFGKEQYPNPWMVVTVPFMRFLAGPADFTPMDFGGNIAFEIANVVNMPGPIITYCERSDLIANSPFASLIRTIPSQWDQTIALRQSQLGQTTATARRKGQDWFIGIMNASATNFWTVPLTFLDSNLTYQADVVRQDSTALERSNVTSASIFSVAITSTNGSGFVAHLYPQPAFAVSTNFLMHGSIIGTSGSWSNSGNTKSNVFDGNLSTYFDAPDPSGDWAGLDLGAANQNIATLIRYCPRATWAGRMVAGLFQGANASDFSDAATLWTVGFVPPDGSLTTVALTNRTRFRYLRYLSPANGSCNVAEVQFYGGTNPPAPANLGALPGLNQIALTWDPFPGVACTVLRSANSGGPYTVIATNIASAAFSDTSVTTGQTYYYVVSAVNPVGLASPNSSEAAATPTGPPGAPTNLAAVPGTNQTSTLTWDALTNATGYRVKRSIVSGGPYAIVAETASNNFSDAALANGVTYFYVVSAVTAQGESPNSAEVPATPGEINSWMLAANPVGYWRLNETSGSTAADSSGNDFNGAYLPAVTLAAPGEANPPYFGFQPASPAASFDGQPNSWVSLPGMNLNSASVTFTAWIDPATATQHGAAGLIFCRDGLGTVSGLDYNPAGTQLGYTWNNDGGTYGWNSGFTPPAGQWSFVALVVTPTNATIDLCNTNGQLSASLTHTQTSANFAGEMRIGNDSYDPSRTFYGGISDAAVFNHALTAGQIATLYQAGVGLYHNPSLVDTWDGSHLALAWTSGHPLLQATNLSGPWSTNAASAPSIVTPNLPQMFYQTR